MKNVAMGHSKKWIFFLFLSLSILLQSSCTSKSELRLRKLAKEVRDEDYLSAISALRKNARLYGKMNRLLYYMDVGVLFHYAGYYDSSTVNLERAVQIYDELFTRSVTNETAALLTNDNIRPYRSKPFEILFIHQVLMLNHLSRNDYDAALVESRRAQLLIDEWERGDRLDTKFTSDGFFHYMSAFTYNQVDEPDNASVSLFKSVQAYQQGVVPLPDQVANLAYHTFTTNDREDDIALLDLKPGSNRNTSAGLGREQSEILLIGYAGRGPVLRENVWWGTWVRDGLLILHHRTVDGQQETVTMVAPPIPRYPDSGSTESGTTFHIKFALPEIQTFSAETGYFTVESSSIDGPVKSIEMNDMDRLCAQYLDDTRAKTIVRTAVRVVARTIAAQRLKKKMATGNGAANLLINFGTDLLADQMEKADTRSLFLVPKSIQIARIPVEPGTHSLEVFSHTSTGTVLASRLFDAIEIAGGEKKVIFYPSLY